MPTFSFVPPETPTQYPAISLVDENGVIIVPGGVGAGVTSVNGETGAVDLTGTFVQPAELTEAIAPFPSDVGLSSISDVELITIDSATTPIFTGVLDGVAYGLRTSPNRLYKSLDSGETWTLVGNLGSNQGGFRKCDDGEVLSTSSTGIYRSTGWATGNPTWALVLAPTTVGANTATFVPWGLDTYGDYAIAAEYISGVVDFSASRYAYRSLDQGLTWAPMYDLEVIAAVPSSSHMHAVAIDRESGRWWLSWHGGDEQDETHYSEDLGVTWTKLVGARHPTVIEDHPNGTVMGLDGTPDGVNYVDASLTLKHLFRIRLGEPTLFGYAQSTNYAPDGTLYIGFKSQIDSTPTIILASPDGLRADEVWRWANTGTQPEIPAIGVTSHGKLIARVRPGDATERFLRATPARRATPVIDTLNSGGILNGQAGQRAVAVGEGSQAAPGGTDRAVANGQYAMAMADNTLANGQRSLASAVSSTANGSRAQATATGATANGDNAVASGSNSTCNGRDSLASGTNSLASGKGSSATALNAVADGPGSSATHIASVALGQGTASTRADGVSVGPRDVEITSATKGYISTAPSGGKWRSLVDDAGALSLNALTGGTVKSLLAGGDAASLLASTPYGLVSATNPQTAIEQLSDLIENAEDPLAPTAPPVMKRTSGSYYTVPVTGKGSLTMALGRQYMLMEFQVDEAITVDRIAVHITGLDAGSTIRLGIHDLAGGKPNTVLLDAGTVDSGGGGTGVKEITIAQALGKGIYALTALAIGGSTGPSVRSVATTPARLIGSSTASNITATTTYVGYQQDAVAGALVTATSPRVPCAVAPLVLLRVA